MASRTAARRMRPVRLGRTRQELLSHDLRRGDVPDLDELAQRPELLERLEQADREPGAAQPRPPRAPAWSSARRMPSCRARTRARCRVCFAASIFVAGQDQGQGAGFEAGSAWATRGPASVDVRLFDATGTSALAETLIASLD